MSKVLIGNCHRSLDGLPSCFVKYKARGRLNEMVARLHADRIGKAFTFCRQLDLFVATFFPFLHLLTLQGLEERVSVVALLGEN